MAKKLQILRCGLRHAEPIVRDEGLMPRPTDGKGIGIFKSVVLPTTISTVEESDIHKRSRTVGKCVDPEFAEGPVL